MVLMVGQNGNISGLMVGQNGTNGINGVVKLVKIIFTNWYHWYQIITNCYQLLPINTKLKKICINFSQ